MNSVEPFNITILGSGSSIPTLARNLSGQFLNIRGKYYLIDCGEGTQFQLIRYKLKYQKIDHIFISHLHGDHYFGLVGLLSSMHLLGRTKDLNIYGPPDLEGIINSQIRNHNTGLNFRMIFNKLGFSGNEMILDNKHIKIETIKLKHRIPCNGFLIKEKPRPRTLNQEAIEKYNIPIYERANIKNGADFVMESGEKVENERMTSAPISPRSYAYCSDTAYYEAIIKQIAGVDLLYHEATFMNDRQERAKETFHSTAEQAAMIAQKARVKKLLLGHISARYKDATGLVKEAMGVFENTVLVREGENYDL